MGEETYEGTSGREGGRHEEEVEERAARESAEEVWGGTEDLTSLSVEELKGLLARFDEEEKRISYRRRVIQGRIDVIRAEIVRRGGAVLSPEELARVLMGDVGDESEGGASGDHRGDGA